MPLDLRRSAEQAERLKKLTPSQVAHFMSAYVYGNILVLAAILGSTPEDIEHGHGALLVLGTGLATLLAHVISESQELLVLRSKNETTREYLASIKEAVHDSSPIFYATIFPAVLLFLGQRHILDAGFAWWASVIVIGLRMLRNGFVIAKFRNEPITGKTMLANIIFAASCLGAALVKVTLTH